MAPRAIEVAFQLGLIDETDLFRYLFSKDAFLETFNQKFARSSGKGIDRINGFQFAPRAEAELAIAARKCAEGTYRFSPYLEVLKLKGRDKAPRLIGIPTVRDRVVLLHLHRLLACLFPKCVPGNVAATYVREVAADLGLQPKHETWVCCTDVEKFYDSVVRTRLMKLVERRVGDVRATTLVRHAIETPTVPKNARRSQHGSFASIVGVPQGLAISNILAAIYLHDVDQGMSAFPVQYRRYVDDVLMYGPEADVERALESLSRRLRRRGLRLHTKVSGKTHLAPLDVPFGYLGYRFEGDHITVRDATRERFLLSIASKFSEFRHNKARRLARFPYLDEKRLCEIFIAELNERITGAVSEAKRYGWIAYFNQINDLKLLYRLDSAIAGMFKRLPEFGHAAPPDLKKLARAYWEMKFKSQGNYIRNYDRIETVVQKLEFLEKRGRLDPKGAPLRDEQILDRYDKYVGKILAAMHSDEGGAYG